MNTCEIPTLISIFKVFRTIYLVKSRRVTHDPTKLNVIEKDFESKNVFFLEKRIPFAIDENVTEKLMKLWQL